VPSEELVARVDSLGSTDLDTVAFRHVSVGSDPRSGTGARIHGGRWNPPNSFATLYLALDVETVILEFRRAARRQGLAPEDFLPRELVRLDVRLTAVLDLRAAAARNTVQLTEEDLSADDPARCREIGDAAHDLALEAVIAPSAAGSGTVLAVFLEKLRSASSLEVRGSETWPLHHNVVPTKWCRNQG
jgi:RES domain-containing protein